ncbi:hypothetical protein [Helicobacter pylori]|uniref:hypothetical protein n=1 Tax=Helicobacter pylori TaxID=210 RepID=UPI00057517F0|nr:hypothetical protein [Helicobacter pylori]KHL77875.1 hypothetical protein HPY1089_05080 [Helicobacter pylori]KHL80276.1 hypothetical protein HPY1152_00760 [Helicobacter pylori]
MSAAGLSRLYEHMTEGQCGTISAFRGSYTRETNMKRTKHLKSLLKALYPEVGFITIQGSCQEKASDIPSNEVSFLSIRSKTIALI